MSPDSSLASSAAFRRRLQVMALAACLFAIVVGMKWATFYRYGSAMPDWDQWDAEALYLYAPWFEHDHFIANLFRPHNEHRVVLTKLQNLALVLLNGQWDARLECVTNALLHAGLGVAFWVLGRRWLASGGENTVMVGGESTPTGRPEAKIISASPPLSSNPPALLAGFLFVLVIALFGLPLAWQNILGGFHSQQYWLLLLSFAAIVALPFARPFGGAWWFGALAGTLALGSMASGFLAAVVVFLLVAWRAWRREITWRSAWPTLALSVVLIAVGWLTRVEVSYHQQLKAKTLHDFVFSILRSLEWPLRDADWAGIVLWLPWALVAWQAARRRGPDMARGALTIAALGGWVLIQLVATAYARGAGADYPASRYMDTPAFGTMVNGLALAWLFARQPRSRPSFYSGWILLLAWLALLGLGLRDTLVRNLRFELPDAKKYYVKAEGHMRRYLANNNPKELAYPDIPFPSVDGLIERLARPSVRALMPVPIRAPLAVPTVVENTGFVGNDARDADLDHLKDPPRAGLSLASPPLDALVSWGSFTESGAAATATWKSGAFAASKAGWLKFETAGQPGTPGVTLQVRAAGSGALLASVEPTRLPGDSWRAAYVRAPRVPFVVVATDRSTSGWLGFSPPVEMGPLSYWAWQAAKNGFLVLWLGAGAAILLGAAERFVRGVPPQRS